MTYDPRAKGLADGLYPERSGKTTRVVATLAARDAIPSGEKYDGMLVQVLETRKLYSWDTANATWDTITGGSGIAKFDTLVDLQAATGMTDGDFATTLDTDKLYRYTNGAWVEFTAGGGGGGIAKYATMDDILVITNPEECDLAIAQDSGIMMMYKDGVWEVAYNSFTDPQASAGWVLSDTIKCVAGTAPSGALDISDCKKFKIEMEAHSTPSAFVYLFFDGDTGNNYEQQYISASGTAVTAARTTSTSAVCLMDPDSANKTTITEFDKTNKLGLRTRITGGASGYVEFDALRYIGAQAMNTLTFSGTGSFDGYIRLYKWVDTVKPVDLVSYELIKKITLRNQALDTTIALDGDLDDTLVIESTLTCNTAGTSLLGQFNSDTAAANYPYSQISQDGTTVAGGAGAHNGLLLTTIRTAGRQSCERAQINLKTGNYRYATLTSGRYFPDNTDAFTSIVTTMWKNSASNIASLRLVMGAVCTGTIRVFKRVQTRMATTNPNIITTALTYVDTNTVRMLPGEIEINGAIMKVTKNTDVTLSGNLKSGLTEAARTRYYMYAVRPSKGSTPTYVFDTVAPLMDRYGNMAANFDAIDITRAWFHPTLGFMYRYVGYVDNDASKNIVSFNKKALVPSSGANVVTKAADYAASDGDKVIVTATCNITLRNAPNAQITVKSGVAGTVTVLPESGTIDGMTSHKILNQYDSNDYVCDGTNWWII